MSIDARREVGREVLQESLPKTLLVTSEPRERSVGRTLGEESDSTRPVSFRTIAGACAGTPELFPPYLLLEKTVPSNANTAPEDY